MRYSNIMNASALILTAFFTLFATATLGYLSMAVSLGPWIEPTIALCATLVLMAMRVSSSQRTTMLTCITAGASLGGIVAISCGFAFPSIYFIQPDCFNHWMQQPLYFCTLMALLVLTAGSFGILIAALCEQRLLVREKLAFPVGTMTYKLISAQQSGIKALWLGISFTGTVLYSAIISYCSSLPKVITCLHKQSLGWCVLPNLRIGLQELPMLWSIGFVTGQVIAVPLLMGMLTKFFVCTPAHIVWCKHVSSDQFLFAFCAGLMLYGALISFLQLLKHSKKMIDDVWHAQPVRHATPGFISYTSGAKGAWLPVPFSGIDLAIGMGMLAAISFFFVHVGFSPITQLYIIVATSISTYQLLLIGGKAGIAPMPRFATFVMMPGILLFGFTGVQAGLVSTFVQLCGGVAVDTLFGRKMALEAGIDRAYVARYQWFGLLVSSMSVGMVFWLLITHIGLGSSQLCAQRAQSRALLMNVYSFEIIPLLLGAVYASLLQELRVNAPLVLGGILMPFDYALVLAMGGLSSYLVRDKEGQYPFWSGMFAASSLWMVVRAVLF